MVNKLTVNALLKSVVAALVAAIVIALALGVWDSWSHLRTANRILAATRASSSLFTALDNLRIDRSATVRDLKADKTGEVGTTLAKVREALVPALQNGIAALREVDLPAAQSGAVTLEDDLKKLVDLHRETASALTQPLASRPAELAEAMTQTTSATIDLIGKLSGELYVSVKMQSPWVDALMNIKELAWTARNAGGNAAVLISDALGGAAVPADLLPRYMAAATQAATAWGAVEKVAAGVPLPASLAEAIAKCKHDYFSPEYEAYRLDLVKTLAGGKKPDLKVAQWLPDSVARLGTIVGVAERALDVARARAESQRAAFMGRLSVQLGLLALALAGGAGVLLMITRRVIGPLQMVEKLMVTVAEGDFDVAVARTERRDEVGQIVTALAMMVERIRATIVDVKTAAREVTNVSAEIATNTSDLSQRTEEQAASLEETSASMEEISATVRANAENAQQANQSAIATRDVAERGGAIVVEAVKAMSRIEESARKMSDIIAVIDEIARQTNLLALNAAVEAARAGEAGRGFAVVASEVRSLAQRSSQAARDITDLITNSNAQVQEGVGLVNQAGTALNEIVESIRSVAALVSGIATASAEQATGLDQISKALAQMDEATQQNSALVEENAATAKTLEEQAQAMDRQVAFFRVAMEPAAPEPAAAAPAAGRHHTPHRVAAAA